MNLKKKSSWNQKSTSMERSSTGVYILISCERLFHFGDWLESKVFWKVVLRVYKASLTFLKHGTQMSEAWKCQVLNPSSCAPSPPKETVSLVSCPIFPSAWRGCLWPVEVCCQGVWTAGSELWSQQSPRLFDDKSWGALVLDSSSL